MVFAIGLVGCNRTKTAPNENENTTSITSNDIMQSEEDKSTQTTSENESPTNAEASASDNKAENTASTTKPTETQSSESDNKDVKTAAPQCQKKMTPHPL